MAALIPSPLLSSARRVLYMSHLALGDYIYQGPYLKQLSERYPHIQFDIWLDDCRRRPKSWHAGRSKMLTEWLTAQNSFGNVYPIASNHQHRQSLIKDCRANEYDLVFFIASHRADRFAKFAKQIAPNGFVAGISIGNAASGWLGHYWLNSIEQHMNLEADERVLQAHITQRYKSRYAKLFGDDFAESVLESTLPLSLPDSYVNEAKGWLRKNRQEDSAKVILLNPISTSSRRNYSWAKLRQLIQLLSAKHNYQFVVNLPPDRLSEFEREILANADMGQTNVLCFSAEQHFFQLPAMIKAADCLVTVETATMHLAACLSVKQVVLMRASAEHWQPPKADKLHFAAKRVEEIAPQEVAQSVLDCLNSAV